MKSLLYIRPYATQFAGVNRKIKDQLKALETQWHASVFSVIPDKTCKFRILIRVLREGIAAGKSLLQNRVYYRYTPACPILNFLLIPTSFLTTVYMEVNTVYGRELPPSTLRFLHRLLWPLIRCSRIRFLAVSSEVVTGERLPVSRTHVMGNGYGALANTQTGENLIKSDKIKAILNTLNGIKKDNNGVVVVMVASRFQAWHGLERLSRLITAMPANWHVILVGELPDSERDKLKNVDRWHELGPVPIDCMRQVYACADIGLSSLAFDALGFENPCPLKAREYLWYGLPVLMNYHDPLFDTPEVRPFLFQLPKDCTNVDAAELRRFIDNVSDRDQLMAATRTVLSWNRRFEEVGLLSAPQEEGQAQ